MPDKKSKEPEKSAEEKALEERVEVMMNPEIPDPTSAPAIDTKPAAKESAVTSGGAEPRTQIKSAPPLASRLRKQIPVSPAAVPDTPLSIDKLDQITGPVEEPTVATTDAPAAEPRAEAAEPPAETASTTESSVEGDGLENAETDKAVDDIVAQEGDIVLAVEDAAAIRRSGQVKKPSRGWKAKLKAFFTDKRTWIGIVVILVIVFTVPMTRYKVLGLVIKKSVTVTVVDSKTNTPVSNAEVSLGGQSGKTDGSGKAKVRAPVGDDELIIKKQYYRDYQGSHFVGFKAGTPAKIKLVATGRLVPLVVTNKITGQPLKGAEISARGTTAKTDAKGKATIALPAASGTIEASLKLSEFNTAKVKLEITDSLVKANNFELTPAGHVYFLSNLNGTLDVVKSNLDGSDRHVVLEGTGKEDKTTTSLLASRDWRYLVLKAKRDSAQPSLHLIDTATDKITTFDESNAEFTLVGWYGHNFIYDLTRNGISNWQGGRQQLKSYDADNRQLNQLDQNQAEGDASSYAQQSFFNFYIVNGAVTYNTQWYLYSASGVPRDPAGKNDTIRAVQANGQNKKDYQSFPTNTIGYIQATLYEPQGVYYAVYNNDDNKTTYYEYENQSVKAVSGIDQNTFNQGYPTYLLSPSGKQTFWTELRDGKNTLFIGDSEAKKAKQIAGRSEYTPYGWYSEDYTLVSKNSSELYVMPAAGDQSSRPPLKITDYYKPAQTFTGYGYGYGGL